MQLHTLRLAAGMLALGAVLVLVEPAKSQETVADDNPVVATVNGEEIRRDEVIEAIMRLPAQVQQMPPQMLIPAIAEQLATGRLMAAAGYAENVQESEEVKRRLAEVERNIVQSVWLDQQLAGRMTEESVGEAYQSYLAENPPAEEVRARHILVESEEEAIALIERLDGGEDFAALAEEASIGPSGPRGGDLGYFTKDQMVEPFAEVAFALAAEATSDAPVQTQFGWHIIKVEDRRMTEQPTLEEVRPQIEEGLADQLIQQIVAELREGAEIVVFGPDGEVPEN
ncbi:MAG: peptidylprolyl isomerase [Inquilinus sp.]|nr:peptidylprolyl isomerase [Inquilinus sp.]